MDAEAQITDDAVKQALRVNVDRALKAGVFGVPTFVFRDMPFWGLDATDFLIDALRDPGLLEDPEMARAAALPATARRRSS